MIIYEEEKFDLSTFIGGWYIPKKDCDELLNFYENNIDKTYTGILVNLVNCHKDLLIQKSKNVVKLQLVKKIIFVWQIILII